VGSNCLKTNLPLYHGMAILLCSGFLFCLGRTTLAEAQTQGGDWSGPYRLSGEEGEVGRASLAADPYGYVHAFWVESGLHDDRSLIQYARFDGEAWAGPVDIHVTWPGIPVAAKAVALDQAGLIHLVWTEGARGPIYYTRAPASDALSARQWPKPVRLDLPARGVALQADSPGVIHLLYTDLQEATGVYYVQSRDQGAHWSSPQRLDPDIPPGVAPTEAGLALDEAGRLHAFWLYLDLDNPDAPGKSIRYARSLDGGATWSPPMTIDEEDEEAGELRAPGPLWAVQAQNVHVIWAGDAVAHREQRFSTDAGQTWSRTSRIFGELHGQAGDAVAVDGAGRLHFVAQMRYPQGLYHACWDRGGWPTPSLFYLIARDASDPIGERIHAHGLSLAVRAGNQLVVTFFDRRNGKNGPLYAMHRTLDDLPPLLARPVPTPTPLPLPGPILSSVVITPTPAEPRSGLGSAPPPGQLLAPGSLVGAGVAPALLLVAGTIACRLLRRH